MKKEPKKENAMAKQPKKETATAASKKVKKAKAKTGVDIKFIAAPMAFGLAYFPGEIVKNYDKKQAEELIESGFAVKI